MNVNIFKKESFELLEHILMEAGELESMLPYEALVNTKFAEEAADKGAKFVLYPESMDYCGLDGASIAEDVLTGECFRTVSEAIQEYDTSFYRMEKDIKIQSNLKPYHHKKPFTKR